MTIYPTIYRPREDVTLYLGDCLDILPTLTGIDAVITDPPYGMGLDTNNNRYTGGQQPEKRGVWNSHPAIAGDDAPFDPSPWLRFDRVVLFGANHYAQRLPVGTTLVWVKKLPAAFGTFLSDAELAWMKGGHGVYCFERTFTAPTKQIEHAGAVGTFTAHPTQKPIGLMRWCMERAKVPVGALVLDPFMGSGTTGVACIRTGRRFIGIEIDPTHYATACRRIDNELQQMTLPVAAAKV